MVSSSAVTVQMVPDGSDNRRYERSGTTNITPTLRTVRKTRGADPLSPECGQPLQVNVESLLGAGSSPAGRTFRALAEKKRQAGVRTAYPAPSRRLSVIYLLMTIHRHLQCAACLVLGGRLWRGLGCRLRLRGRGHDSSWCLRKVSSMRSREVPVATRQPGIAGDRWSCR